MKAFVTYGKLALAIGSVFCLSFSTLIAADTNNPVAVTNGAPPAQPAVIAPTDANAGAVKLPYGVEDVLKLSRANISDEIIVNYIQNSGTIYTLAPQDIVYLRNQGVSDRVVNTMVGQRKLVESAVQTQQQPVPIAAPNPPVFADSGLAPVVPAYAEQGPAYTEPESTSSGSSVYVIPYPQATAAYYGYYGYSPYSYYSPYYSGYCGASVAIGIGYGSCGYYGHGHYYGHGYHGYYGHGGHGWHH
jgi:hypothetical protein